jgi:hypothetical protein
MEDVTQSAYPEPLPREQMRAADADRQATVDQLRRAHDDGRLSLAEFDERVRSAYAARTYADLMRLTVDLPDVQHPPAMPNRGAPDVAAFARPGPFIPPRRRLDRWPSGTSAASSGASWAAPGSASA